MPATSIRPSPVHRTTLEIVQLRPTMTSSDSVIGRHRRLRVPCENCRPPSIGLICRSSSDEMCQSWSGEQNWDSSGAEGGTARSKPRHSRFAGKVWPVHRIAVSPAKLTGQKRLGILGFRS